MSVPEQMGVYYGCTNLQSEPIRSLCIFIRQPNIFREMKPQPQLKRIIKYKEY